MSADVSDLSLVRRVQRGDKGAFDALVLKYQHKLVKLVMRYVRNPAEAEDIAQEAFIKAYRALPQFRGDSAFYTWLYRIAINTAKNAVVSRHLILGLSSSTERGSFIFAVVMRLAPVSTKVSIFSPLEAASAVLIPS